MCLSLTREPTPDPIHLNHVPDDATLVWGYPPGVSLAVFLYTTVSSFV